MKFELSVTTAAESARVALGDLLLGQAIRNPRELSIYILGADGVLACQYDALEWEILAFRLPLPSGASTEDCVAAESAGLHRALHDGKVARLRFNPFDPAFDFGKALLQLVSSGKR